MRPSATRLAARWLAASYDRWSPSMSLRDVIEGWQKRGVKLYEDSMPAYYSARVLWPLREYTWKREDARSGYAKVRGRSVWLEGPVKWDALREDMRQRGWDPTDPLHLSIGRQGGVKVAEGNHRLAIAREIKLSKIPVWFHFYSGRVVKSPMVALEPVEVTPKAVKKVVQERPAEPMTPEKQKQVDDIMKLLGF